MLELAIGNKTYSSWSLRPWLLMRALEVPFQEIRIPLYQQDSRAALLKRSSSGKVPALRDGDGPVWDSLAIAETIAERVAAGRAWPRDPAHRARARSISSEMHASFLCLRSECPMNLRKIYQGFRASDGALADAARVIEIWRDARAQCEGQGPFLFGDFSIADAMFAPVAARFVTYGFALGEVERNYVDALLNLPAFGEWLRGAQLEEEVIECFEMPLPHSPFVRRRL